ncbi:hypothetical protein [Neochlamydia sp. S13]|uniref:hypothetical protein n=1 Tax=Neochlamydia sp. S13 TaxID=1353976 RepID=UPI0005AB72DD|nr:hypothetical protein [Neochlamydia sp. S13]BBI18312.1 hypothetical protein NCS13_2_0115 [Neochlamydia sp. S13]
MNVSHNETISLQDRINNKGLFKYESLVSKKTQVAVITFTYFDDQWEMTCANSALYQSFYQKGIAVPKDKRSFFQDRKVITMEDNLFPIAFFEILAPHRFPPDQYEYKAELKKL